MLLCWDHSAEQPISLPDPHAEHPPGAQCSVFTIFARLISVARPSLNTPPFPRQNQKFDHVQKAEHSILSCSDKICAVLNSGVSHSPVRVIWDRHTVSCIDAVCIQYLDQRACPWPSVVRRPSLLSVGLTSTTAV